MKFLDSFYLHDDLLLPILRIKEEAQKCAEARAVQDGWVGDFSDVTAKIVKAITVHGYAMYLIEVYGKEADKLPF